MNMTITFATIHSAVKRHLSIIGKRLYTKDGKNMFSDITLSSAEETPILVQYTKQAIHDVEAALKKFITASTISGTGAAVTMSITITNSRGDSDFATRTQEMVETYVTTAVLGEYLSMLHPDIAQKYNAEAVRTLQTLAAYVFYKKPPTSSASSFVGTGISSTVTAPQVSPENSV